MMLHILLHNLDGDSSKPIICHKFMNERLVCLYFNLHFSSICEYESERIHLIHCSKTYHDFYESTLNHLVTLPQYYQREEGFNQIQQGSTKREKPSQFLYYLSWSALLPQFSSNHQRYVCNPPWSRLWLDEQLQMCKASRPRRNVAKPSQMKCSKAVPEEMYSRGRIKRYTLQKGFIVTRIYSIFWETSQLFLYHILGIF